MLPFIDYLGIVLCFFEDVAGRIEMVQELVAALGLYFARVVYTNSVQTQINKNSFPSLVWKNFPEPDNRKVEVVVVAGECSHV